MKKVILSLFCICFLVGCEKETTTVVTLNLIEETIKQTVVFEDALVPLKEAALERIYPLDKIVVSEKKGYASSGATAEEFVILNIPKAEDRKKAKTALEEYKEDKQQLYESYAPKEVEKIKQAELIEKDSYLILIIGKNNKTIASKIKNL